MNEEDKIQFIGQRLLQRGFKDWFLFFFKTIEKNDFLLELIHDDLFKSFQEIYEYKTIRQIINLPPRSAKTTLCIYFLAYCLAHNPTCQFIYTSYSQDLLKDNSRRLASILTNNLYKDMYLSNVNIEEETTRPIDDFWTDYFKKENKEFKISSRKITTAQGGVVLFASMGSQITGFGAGNLVSSKFSGCLIIDDGNKPNDIKSKKIREKTNTYFTETLLTRLNNSNVPVLNIQQRLHQEDLSGYLLKEYNYNLLKKSLINQNSICELPKQYDIKRIEELKKNNYLWQAQYQQEPILQGGNIIKSEWFVKTSIIPNSFDFVYMTCDTAFSTKTSADNSVFLLNGIKDKELYLLDCKVGKWGMPDLKRNLLDFYNFAKNKYHNFSTIYIENKASGQSLIQELQDFGLPVDGILPTVKGKLDTKEYTADKYTRLMEVISDLSNGYVKIPVASNWQNEFLEECETFTGLDDTHDDRVDSLIYALKIRRRLLFERPIDWNEMNNIFFRQ